MQPDVACESAMEGAQKGLGLLLGAQEWDVFRGFLSLVAVRSGPHRTVTRICTGGPHPWGMGLDV